MAATAAILKIYFRLLLQNRLLDWAEIWYGASGQPVDARLAKSWQYDIQYGCHGSHLENLFSTSSPEPLVGLSWNLVWSIGATSRCMVVQIVVIRYQIWLPWRPSWKSNWTSSPEPLIGLSWNLVWSFRAMSRFMVVQIIPIRYPIWPPW